MKVMFIITGLGIGGAEVQLQKIATHLKQRGWQITVCALYGGTEMRQHLEESGILVKIAPGSAWPLKPLRWFQWLHQAIRRIEPDCIISFMLQANLLARLIGKRTQTPVITSIRNSRFGGSTRFGQFVGDLLERSTRKLGFTTVVNSHFTADELVRRSVLDEDDYAVIVNGIDVPPRRAPQRPGPGPFRWLTVGRLVPQKNHRLLLKAVAKLVEEGMDIELHIAGEGPLEGELRLLAEELSISERVAFLGLSHDVQALMNSANGFVLASLWEGLPNVIMEAMASGLPIVATSVGGTGELILNRQTGLLVDSDDCESLVSGMMDLMGMEYPAYSHLADQAYGFVKDRFSLRETVDRWHNLILQATKG